MPGNMYVPRERSPWESMLPNLITQLAMMKVAQNFRLKEAEIQQQSELEKGGWAKEPPRAELETGEQVPDTSVPKVNLGGQTYYLGQPQVQPVSGRPGWVRVTQGTQSQFVQTQKGYKGYLDPNTLKVKYVAEGEEPPPGTWPVGEAATTALVKPQEDKNQSMQQLLARARAGDKEAEAQYKQLRADNLAQAVASGQGRAQAWENVRTAEVFDTKDYTRKIINVKELNRAAEEEPDRYLSGAAAERAMNKQALMTDIVGRIGDTEQALKKMPEFTSAQAAQLSIAMRGPNPGSAVSTVFRTEVGKTLTPEQQHYIINLTQLQENMLAMRTILGAGQSSDMLRAAVEATIPNPTSPNKTYAAKQLTEAKRTVHRLARGIPNVPLKPMEPVGEGTPGKGKLDATTAQQYLQQAGGDKAKARELAKADGWEF